MIWAILAAVGVPLWLCAAGILTLVFRNRGLRRREGNVPVRMLPAGKQRWIPGHGVWVHDVFGFRGSPAAWKDELLWVEDATVRPASVEERKHLHRLGEEPVVVTFTLSGGKSVALASRPEHQEVALGPFTAVAAR